MDPKGANLASTDLLEISELVSGSYVTKSITGAEIVASVPPTVTSWGTITGTLSTQTDLQTALNGKEPTITAGTIGQYYRGDKSFQTLNKTAVGLSNVDNTSDANKPISTATQTALNAKQATVTLTTTGTGAATFVSNVLNVPTPASATFTSLTTTGTSGASTLTAGVLNVPTYSLSGLGGVPTSRTLTINGTTQDLSADRTFTVSTGITIGTTAITSGTVGRVLFEGTGNVVQESANLFWDNTNGRLGVGTSSPASKIDILQVADNTSPTLLRLNNTGSGASTGATLEFPFGAFIRSSFASMILSDRSGATVTLQGSSLTTTASNFSLAGAGIITFTGGTGTDGMIRTGGTITFNTFSSVYRDVGKFFQTGNFLIQTGGTFTDAGYKLDVNGTARVVGDATINTLKIGLGGGQITTNTALGYQALQLNSTGARNIGVGYQSNFTNSTGADNTAIGHSALFSNTAYHNTAVGSQALYTNTGNNNSAFGRNAMVSNSSGAQNTGIGRDALSANTTGSDNSALGYQTDSGNFSGSTILGRGATATASNQFVVGSTTTVAGAVTSEVNTSTQVWNVIINGVARKILLA